MNAAKGTTSEDEWHFFYALERCQNQPALETAIQHPNKEELLRWKSNSEHLELTKDVSDSGDSDDEWKRVLAKALASRQNSVVQDMILRAKAATPVTPGSGVITQSQIDE